MPRLFWKGFRGTQWQQKWFEVVTECCIGIMLIAHHSCHYDLLSPAAGEWLLIRLVVVFNNYHQYTYSSKVRNSVQLKQ